tara:strand:- start:15159 stop:15623 length:465 start_codon:yes stop_codon:yes gene_type:complete
MPKALDCSFCGKSQHEVHKLIAGPAVHICDECIALCNKIIEDTGGDGPFSGMFFVSQTISEMRYRGHQLNLRWMLKALGVDAKDVPRAKLRTPLIEVLQSIDDSLKRTRMQQLSEEDQHRQAADELFKQFMQEPEGVRAILAEKIQQENDASVA